MMESVLNDDARMKMYQTYRKVGQGFHSKLFKMVEREVIMEYANLFNMINDEGMFVFEDEEEVEKLAEFVTHDYEDKHGKTLPQKLSESPKCRKLNQTEVRSH